MNRRRRGVTNHLTKADLDRDRQIVQPLCKLSASRDGNGTTEEPALIFIRNRVFEREYGLRLAGLLLTDIVLGAKLSDSDRQFIEKTLRKLEVLVNKRPAILIASYWRSAKPAKRLTLPIDCRLLQKRHLRCVSVLVTAGSASAVRVTGGRLRWIVGYDATSNVGPLET
jgi:hypothetical protein